jgi:hypothetical protein
MSTGYGEQVVASNRGETGLIFLGSEGVGVRVIELHSGGL